MLNPVLVVTNGHEVHVFLNADEALPYTEWLNRQGYDFNVVAWAEAVGSIDANGDPITYHKFERDSLEGVGVHVPAIVIHEPIA